MVIMWDERKIKQKIGMLVEGIKALYQGVDNNNNVYVLRIVMKANYMPCLFVWPMYNFNLKLAHVSSFLWWDNPINKKRKKNLF